MIDPNTETLITLKQVTRRFPGRTCRGVSLSCVQRWIAHGRRGQRLETILVGGQRYSSEEAVLRFIQALNPENTATGEQRGNGSGQDDAVEMELEANGF